MSSLNQNDLPTYEYQLSALLQGESVGRKLMHRKILCNQNINILIELMEHLNVNIQLSRPSLGGMLYHTCEI